ncbi:MAG TPA: ABC transporter substrate-binding protein [Aestuariivirga sp.]|nr:ABC transporter substrate-binding protein [Aestuariivirga sp.]
MKLDDMKILAAKGRMSRRDFVQLGLIAGLTAAAAEGMFVNAVRAAAKQGGSARIGLAHGSTTDSLDPGTWPDTFTQTVFWGSAANSLTQVDHKGGVIADLAESFEPADGAKTWVFKLRQGLEFHNGKSVTATDVVESFRHHMGAESKSAAKSLLKSVADIKADGPQTVVFTLEGGNADFPYIASDYHIPVMPAKDGGGVDWQSGIYTGAFKLDKFEPGISASLKRNPNYHWEGMPHFDAVEFIAIPDTAARMNALTTGDVHFIGRVDLKTVAMMQRNPNLVILEQTGFGHYVLPMNVTIAPFDNVDVRLALKWAVDREEIAKKIFLGHATPGNDNPIAPSVKFAIDPQPRHIYDPERARSHVKKAGLSSLKVDLSVADAAFSGAVDAGVLFKESAAKAGIDINLIREPNDGYWDKVWLKKAWCASYWSGRPNCDGAFSIAYAADAAWNETFWKNPRFNELLISARAETDEATRATMYAEMQQLVHDDGGLINLVFNNFVDAYSDKLAHGPTAANWENDGLRIAERWWFA